MYIDIYIYLYLGLFEFQSMYRKKIEMLGVGSLLNGTVYFYPSEPSP